MHRYVVERLARLCLVLLFLSIIVFTIVRLIPGDPAAVMLGTEATLADDVPFIRVQPQPFRWGSTAKVGGFSINSQSRPFVALREMTLAR
ncbi:MAG: hypothetical protein HY359_06920 [Candidatus Rokubacteria bacterium]|nr:hypothetical protein [Candidatus Rokubacteria bacterium]